MERSSHQNRHSLKEAQVVIEQWRVQYNTVRPHSALGYRPPAPGAYSYDKSCLAKPLEVSRTSVIRLLRPKKRP